MAAFFGRCIHAVNNNDHIAGVGHRITSATLVVAILSVPPEGDQYLPTIQTVGETYTLLTVTFTCT